MTTNSEERKRKRYAFMRSMYDYTMGVLWIGVGVFFLWHLKFGFDMGLDQTLTTIFGASSLMYGIFRLYRGFKAGKLINRSDDRD